jgi:hypothetical protein
MTYTAFDMQKRLVEEEGYDPKSDEYYDEIDKKIILEFHHKFANMEVTKKDVFRLHISMWNIFLWQ